MLDVVKDNELLELLFILRFVKFLYYFRVQNENRKETKMYFDEIFYEKHFL